MTVKELLADKLQGCADFEVYTSRKPGRLHTDTITNIDGAYSYDVYEDCEVRDYWIMDEDEYDSTIFANCSDYFVDYYNEDDKVLVIVLYDNWADGCKLDADIAVKNLRTKKEYEFDSLRDFREFVLDKRGNADSEDIDRAKTIDQLFDLLPYSEYERIR